MGAVIYTFLIMNCDPATPGVEYEMDENYS